MAPPNPLHPSKGLRPDPVTVKMGKGGDFSTPKPEDEKVAGAPSRLETAMTRNQRALSLSAFEVFQDTPTDQRSKIRERLTIKEYPNGAVIYSEGEPAEKVWFLAKGLVSAVRFNPGREIVTGLTLPFSMFGMGEGFTENSYLATTAAETDVEVLCLPRKDFIAWMEKSPEAARGFARSLSRLLRIALLEREMNLSSVENRLVYILQYLSHYFGAKMPLTREQFARFANTTLETCVRTFKSLEKKGLVRAGRGYVEVADPGRLADLLKS